jgi:hypothetical protein
MLLPAKKILLISRGEEERSMKKWFIICIVINVILLSCTTLKQEGTWDTVSKKEIPIEVAAEREKSSKTFLTNYTKYSFNENIIIPPAGQIIQVQLNQTKKAESWSEIAKIKTTKYQIEENQEKIDIYNNYKNNIFGGIGGVLFFISPSLLSDALQLEEWGDAKYLAYGLFYGLGTLCVLGAFLPPDLEQVKSNQTVTTYDYKDEEYTTTTPITTSYDDNSPAQQVKVYYNDYEYALTNNNGIAEIPISKDKILRISDLETAYYNHPYSKLVNSNYAEEFKNLVIKNYKKNQAILKIETRENSTNTVKITNASKTISYNYYSITEESFRAALQQFVDKYINNNLIEYSISKIIALPNNDTLSSPTTIASNIKNTESLVTPYFSGQLASAAQNCISNKIVTADEQRVKNYLNDRFYFIPGSDIVIKSYHPSYPNYYCVYQINTKANTISVREKGLEVFETNNLKDVFLQIPLAKQIMPDYIGTFFELLNMYPITTKINIKQVNASLNSYTSGEQYSITSYSLSRESFNYALQDFINQEILPRIKPLYFSVKDELTRVPIANVHLTFVTDSPKKEALADRYFKGELKDNALNYIPDYLVGINDFFSGLSELDFQLYTPTIINIQSSHPDYYYFEGKMNIDKEDKKTLLLIKIGSIITVNPGEKNSGRIEGAK